MLLENTDGRTKRHFELTLGTRNLAWQQTTITDMLQSLQ